MCDYIEEAMFEQALRERNIERKRLYLERCLQQQKKTPLRGQEQKQAQQPALATR